MCFFSNTNIYMYQPGTCIKTDIDINELSQYSVDRHIKINKSMKAHFSQECELINRFIGDDDLKDLCSMSIIIMDDNFEHITEIYL